MGNVQTLTGWIESELRKREWKPADLARKGRITPTQVSRVLNGTRGPGPKFLAAIARAFGMPLEEVMRLAGQLPPAPSRANDHHVVYEVNTEAAVMDLWRALNAADQAMVIDLMRRLAQVEPRIIGEEEE